MPLYEQPHLDHIELGNAILVHTHGHGDPVLLDQHGQSLRKWRRGGEEDIHEGKKSEGEMRKEGRRDREWDGRDRGEGGLLCVIGQITS